MEREIKRENIRKRINGEREKEISTERETNERLLFSLTVVEAKTRLRCVIFLGQLLARLVFSSPLSPPLLRSKYTTSLIV